MVDLQADRLWIREELRKSIAFWMENGLDRVNGGMYTYLDREGKIYCTDKSVWMQGRTAWMYSYLCHVYGVREEWLEVARSCLDFMEKHCINREAGCRMYYLVSAEGKPLQQRNQCFSESFYAIANAEYYGVTGDEACLERAKAAYELVWKLNNHLIDDPVGVRSEAIAGSRPTRSQANPMIFLNTSSILKRVDPKNSALYDQRSEQCVHDILNHHLKRDMHCLLETVGPNGEYLRDVSAGRVVNPGHDMECSWFLMEFANETNNPALHQEAEQILRDAMQAGWDNTYGGVLYLLDSENLPRESMEHDVKRWWPQAEMLISSLMAYRDTGDETYLGWFERGMDYVKQRFADAQFGEWFGLLRRDGMRSDPAFKGSAIKGPFHVPRMLSMVDQMLTQIIGD